MFNRQAWDMINSRLDKVEEHVANCAQREELNEVKHCLENTNAALADNRKTLGTLENYLTEIKTAATAKEKSDAKRLTWLGLALAILVPVTMEIKDILIRPRPAISQQQVTTELLKQLIEMQNQK